VSSVAVCAISAASMFAAAPVANAATSTFHPLGARPPVGRLAPRPVMTAMATLPTSVNLRTWAMPVGNQGMVGSCVTWAIDYGMLGWYSKKSGRVGAPFAPMYTYSQINGGGDNGSWPTDALAVARNQGSDTRAHYGHSDYDWLDQPTQAEKDYAAHYKISAYHTLFMGAGQSASANAIKTALATQHPVAITIPVRPGFDNLGSSAAAVDDDVTGSIRGYHEVLAVGYDAGGIIIQNSWGTGWANDGFGRLSWRVVARDVSEADYIDGFAADAGPPLVKSVTAAVVGNRTVAGTVPYTVSWSSMGAPTSYSVSYTVDGGASVPVTLSSAKATSYIFDATVGSTYVFSVTATDALNRTSDAVSSESFTPALAQEADGSISYSGIWSSSALAGATDGQVTMTNKALASATITTGARGIAWVATRGKTRGSAKVYVDGKLRATVNLYALATSNGVIAYTVNFGSAGSHTVSVVGLATVGHPVVDVDAFVVTT
jgi:hypothetical protein